MDHVDFNCQLVFVYRFLIHRVDLPEEIEYYTQNLDAN